MFLDRRVPGGRHGGRRQRIAERRDARREVSGIGQVDVAAGQALHHLAGQRHRVAQHVRAVGRWRRTRHAQALDPGFHRRQNVADGGDVDHRDGAVERMHGAQQRFGRRFRRAVEVFLDHAEVRGNFALQDVEQDRVDVRQRARDQFARAVGKACLARQVSAAADIGAERRQSARRDRHAPSHRAPHGAGQRHAVAQPRFLAGGEAVGGFGDAFDVRLAGRFATQGAEQDRDRGDGVPDQGDDRCRGGNGAVEDAVEQALDLPAEFAQRERSHQTSRTLEGVEGAADRLELVEIGRIALPRRQLPAQVRQFLLDLLDEDLADVVVDFLAGRALEPGRGLRLERDFLLDFLFDLGPATVRIRRGGPAFGDVGLHQAQAIEVLRAAVGRSRVTDDEVFQRVARQHVHRRQAGARQVVAGVGLGSRRRRRRLHDRLAARGGRRQLEGGGHRGDRGEVLRRGGWQRPVAERLEALARDVEDAVAAAALVARGFQVVLDRGQCIGQLVHLFGGRHALVRDQLDLDEAHHRVHQLAGADQAQHAQRTGDFLQQAGDLADALVVPRRFDEGDDVLLGLLQVDCRLAHQRIEDAAHLGLGQVQPAFGRGLVLAGGAEALDVVVQRCFDVEQRAGDVEQRTFVHRAMLLDHLLDHAALLGHHAPRHAEAEHAERVADAVEHLDLRRQLAGIGAAAAQEDVERFLDPHQVVLDGGRDGAEQVAVAPGHRPLRMLQLARRRQQGVELVGAADFRTTRTARAGAFLAGMGNVIKEVLGQLARRGRREAGLARFGEAVDLAIDPAEQQLDRDARFEVAVLHRVDHAGRDPPQAARLGAMRQRAQAIEYLDQPPQVLGRAFVADPLQQGRLESQAQAQRLGAQLALRHRDRAARGGRGQRQFEVG